MHTRQQARQEAYEQKAQQLVREELSRLGRAEEALHTRRKGDKNKVLLARRLRQETTMSLK